jgi:RNA-binding protein YhbY
MSQNTEKLIEEIYADSKVTPGEITKLRQAVAEQTAKVIAEIGEGGVASAMTKSFEVTEQLVQETLLKVRKDKWSDLGRAHVASMIEAHIALLQANVKAFNG